MPRYIETTGTNKVALKVVAKLNEKGVVKNLFGRE
jgi:hypothetical protein